MTNPTANEIFNMMPAPGNVKLAMGYALGSLASVKTWIANTAPEAMTWEEANEWVESDIDWNIMVISRQVWLLSGRVITRCL